MAAFEIRDKWALVTGASSGIGLELAREFAARGTHVVLVARRREKLEELAAELQDSHGVQAEVEVCDLAEEGATLRLYDTLRSRQREIDVLVNNAGFARHGDFFALERSRVQEMLRVNNAAAIELAHLFGQDMVSRGSGYLVFVASITGIVPTPSYSAYSATKAFLDHFCAGLEWELQGTGVRCLSVNPGATHSGFAEAAGQRPNFYSRIISMDSRAVARITVRSLRAGNTRVITGWRNWWTVTLVKPFPRRFVGWSVWKLMGRGRRSGA